MEKRDKEKFYLFLDIDGVLWDWNWRKSCNPKANCRIPPVLGKLNPNSVKALNILIEYLEKDYDLQLVISSTWRIGMALTIKTLEKNNVNLPKNITRTPINIFAKNRGLEIRKYLEGKENKENILIIDDKTFDFDKLFESDCFIKTDIINSGLTIESSENWISKRQENLNELS